MISSTCPLHSRLLFPMWLFRPVGLPLLSTNPSYPRANTSRAMANALQIQEVVDQCIDFFWDSPSDLQACALVSFSWKVAAQPHIFSDIAMGSASWDKLWPGLQDVLRCSPHLVRHIRHLQLYSQELSFGTLSAVCQFPFTHLQSASIYDGDLDRPVALALQPLLSLHTLARMKIAAEFSEPSSFLQMWESFSPSVRHLDLICDSGSVEDVLPIPAHGCPPIILESLRIRHVNYIGNWLMHELCPLDASQLKILSMVFGLEEVLQYPRFAPALRTIEVLCFISRTGVQFTQPLNLSAFPNLVVIRMGGTTKAYFQRSLDILSTITTHSRIRKVIIGNSSLDDTCCEQLDATLASLRVDPLPVLEIELLSRTRGPTINTLHQLFPRMVSRNLLRHVEYRHNWFENFAGV
ncbi:hypothetical protein FB451DRAFT_184185 [Mycena latifolia]|nr:hypothetical protein FB451DRAFT_184185 [Mycena latifolia]